MSKAFDYLFTPGVDDKPAEPYGWIQWKGTKVCADIHCVCGDHGHIDADFAYFYQCKCGRRFALSGYFKLIEIPQEHDDIGEQIIVCEPSLDDLMRDFVEGK